MNSTTAHRMRLALGLGVVIGAIFLGALSDHQLAALRAKALHARPAPTTTLTPTMKAYKERYVLGDVTIVAPAYFRNRMTRGPRAIPATLLALDDTVAVITDGLDLGFQPRKETTP